MLLILFIIIACVSGQEDYEIYHANDIISLLEKTKVLDLNKVNIVGDLDISNIKNINYLILRNSIISDEINLNGINVYQGVNFFNTSFLSTANFNSTNFAGPVKFVNSTFERDALFSETNFNEETNFEYARFKGKLDIKKSKFKDKDANINFKETKFEGNSNFAEAQFEGIADFEKSTFKGIVNFNDSTFNKGCEFRDSEFNDSFFSKAKFADTADYENATFYGTANFISATFSKMANFNYASFMKDGIFDESFFGDIAKFNSFFNGAVDLRHSDINADFSAAIFHGDSNVNIAGSRLVYININYDYIRKPLPCERPLLMKLRGCYGGQKEIQDKISIRAAECTNCPAGDYGCQLYKYIEGIDKPAWTLKTILIFLIFNLIIFPLFYWRVGCLNELEKERITKIDYIYLSIACILSQKHGMFKRRCCRWAALLQFVLFTILLFLIALIIADNLKAS
jgi:hypothetical protein